MIQQFVLWVEPDVKVGWRSSTEVSGAPFAIPTGITKMLGWSASNWVISTAVQLYRVATMAVEGARSGLTKWLVKEMKDL